MMAAAIVICIISLQASGQEQYTIYDDFPGIQKSYKPCYDPGFPAWAKMLYQPVINFNDISQEFEAYEKQHPGAKSAINRYFLIILVSFIRFSFAFFLNLPDGIKREIDEP